MIGKHKAPNLGPRAGQVIFFYKGQKKLLCQIKGLKTAEPPLRQIHDVHSCLYSASVHKTHCICHQGPYGQLNPQLRWRLALNWLFFLADSKVTISFQPCTDTSSSGVNQQNPVDLLLWLMKQSASGLHFPAVYSSCCPREHRQKWSALPPGLRPLKITQEQPFISASLSACLSLSLGITTQTRSTCL